MAQTILPCLEEKSINHPIIRKTMASYNNKDYSTTQIVKTEIRYKDRTYSISTCYDSDTQYLRAYLTDYTETKLYESQLKAAINEGDYINQSKSKFITEISHEIRTPLNGIVGMLSLVKETQLNPEQKYCIENMSYSVDLLMNVVKSISAYSMSKDNEIEIKHEIFDLDALLDHVSDMITPNANTKSLNFSCYLEAHKKISCNGDFKHISDILCYIANNAIENTPTGEVAIRARVTKQTQQVIDVFFRISDTGCGIELDKQEFILTPY